MKCRRVEILAAAVVLFVSASPVMAVIEFKDGLTHNIDYRIRDDVWVDYESPGLETTLNILDGATIPYPYDVKGWEDSIINILGGSVERIIASKSSRVTVSGGSINYLLNARDSSQVTVSGGSMDRLHAYDSSQVTLSGGSINEYLVARGSSQVDVSGGSMDWLVASDSSQVAVSGGSIDGELHANFGGILTLHGWDFAVDGTPVGYTELYSIFGGSPSQEPYRHLTGILASGDPLDNGFYIGQDAKICLVPEPATLLLLGLGGLALLRKRRL